MLGDRNIRFGVTGRRQHQDPVLAPQHVCLQAQTGLVTEPEDHDEKQTSMGSHEA